MRNNMLYLDKDTITPKLKFQTMKTEKEILKKTFEDMSNECNRKLISLKNVKEKQLCLSDISIKQELLDYKISLTEDSSNRNSQIGIGYIHKESKDSDNDYCFLSNSFSLIRSKTRSQTINSSFTNDAMRSTFFCSFQSNDKKSIVEEKSTKASLLRQSYIEKLSNCKVSFATQTDYNNLFIFDWDDTLLCTSYITPDGFFNENEIYDAKDNNYFTLLESTVYELLGKCIEIGLTFIISNSISGWVEYSAKRFYPRIYHLLSKITIISSRTKFESVYPNDAQKWKIKTFEEIKEEVQKKGINNILSFGDSLIELKASQIFTSKYNDVYIKAIKLITYPSPIELNKQLQFIIRSIHDLVGVSKNITMKIQGMNKSYTYQSIKV